jgi:hypothetical protein
MRSASLKIRRSAVRWRVIVATLAAPLVALIAAWLSISALAAVFLSEPQNVREFAGGAAHTFGFFLLFGLVPAYIASLLALPIYEALRTWNRLRPAYVIAAAALLGGVTLPVAVRVVADGASLNLGLVVAGLVAGAAGGATFWFVALPSASSQPPA